MIPGSHWAQAALAAVALAGASCTVEESGAPCVAGQTIECACPGGELSVSTCQRDGSFGSCDCASENPDGGSGGGASGGVCLEGETRACECAGGAAGFALCLEGGQSWSDCVCDASPSEETPRSACERVLSSTDGASEGSARRLVLSNRDSLRDERPQVPAGCLIGNGAMGFSRAIRHVMASTGRLSVRSDNAGTLSTLDTVIVVTEGSCSASSPAIACNDDIEDKTYTSRVVTPPLQAGTEVTIWVGGYDPPWSDEITAVGEIELRIEEQAEAPACTPRCTAADGTRATCGSDGCGGTCGACAEGTRCVGSRCESTCEAVCGNRTCGPDGCGGSCGTCAPGFTCDANGSCSCSPRCAPGVCGPDSNGCGGVCACPAGQVCDGGRCGPAPCVPRCAPGTCGGSNGCNGTCGCASGNYCASGRCVPCSGGRCVLGNVGGRCGTLCGCGQVSRCNPGLICRANVCTAPVCVPRCTACNTNDGCGGTCRCPSGQSCISGVCRTPTCVPRCTPGLCGGSNGCGGSCGCEAGLSCQSGRCVRPSSGGSSGGGGANAAGCISVSRPSCNDILNSSCWVRFRNNCSRAVYVDYRGRGSGGADIAPGGSASTGRTVAELGLMLWGACYLPARVVWSGSSYICR